MKTLEQTLISKMIYLIMQFKLIKLVLKLNAAILKAEVDKIDIDKLKTVPIDLSKVSNVINNDFVTKKLCIISQLVKNIYTIDVLKTKYDIYEADLEKKITDADKKSY